MKNWTLVALVVAGAFAGACSQKAADTKGGEASSGAEPAVASPEAPPAGESADQAARGPAEATAPAFGVPAEPAARPPAARRPASRAATRQPPPPARESRRADRVERVDDADWPATVEDAEAEPEPERVERFTLPAGTELRLVLENGLSSETSEPGDRVTARVERATSDDGRIVLPGGTVLRGRVTDARAAGRVKGRARLGVSFDEIVVRGRTHRLDTTDVVVEAESGAKRDAATVGGAAAVGAIIGGIADGGKGAKKGALIGGAMGTGAVLATRGKDVELPAGSRWTVRVRDAVRF